MRYSERYEEYKKISRFNGIFFAAIVLVALAVTAGPAIFGLVKLSPYEFLLVSALMLFLILSSTLFTLEYFKDKRDQREEREIEEKREKERQRLAASEKQ